MNFYLIYGTNKSLIERKIQTIATKNNIDNNNIIRYNLKDNTTDDIIEEALMNSMFIKNKLVVVETTLKEDNLDVDKLEKYIDNYNKNNYIVFISYSDKIDTRRKIYKLFLKEGKIEEALTNQDNAIEFVKNSLKENNYKMNNYDITYLIEKIGNNIDNIENELNKLYLYKIDNKIIDRNDIDDIVIENFDNEIFAITDAVVKNDINKSINLYNEFMNKNYEVTQIIGLLASQFQFLYQVKHLSNNNKHQEEIAKYLEVHPYRVKLAMQNIYNYTETDLLHYLDRLATLDKKIKLGEINKNVGLELFLLNKDL